MTDTTPGFNACVGPSAGKAHIGYSDRRQSLTLCERTSVVTFVSGKLDHGIICLVCLLKMAEILKEHRALGHVVPKCDTAEDLALALGLEKIK
jgi:hypothetical protein